MQSCVLDCVKENFWLGRLNVEHPRRRQEKENEKHEERDKGRKKRKRKETTCYLCPGSPMSQTPASESLFSPTQRAQSIVGQSLKVYKTLYSLILARISESLNKKYSWKKGKPDQCGGQKKGENKPHTSSPTLIEFPPHPGRRTRSPALTTVGMTTPSLLGAPGPTAMTVASGRGLLVAEVGRKIPVAVFCF